MNEEVQKVTAFIIGFTYIEIHTEGSTGEVKKVLAKLEWLKQWRKL